MNKSLLLVLSALVPLSVADEVKLKDGTVYKDCTVEVETPESISVMVVVSGGIKESKTIKRELIETITKASRLNWPQPRSTRTMPSRKP